MTDIENKKVAIKSLLDNAQHHRDFYALLIGAVLLALGGIFADSIPVLIASMIVAPLAFPILALGLGLAVRDWRLVTRMIGLLVVACLLALILAIAATVLFNDIRVKDVYVTFTENHYLATAVAIVAGGIAAFGMMRPRVSSAITGVAIAVSLIPPLVATGIGLASADTDLTTDAFTLFILNVAGILVASIIVFTLFRVGRVYRPEPIN